MPLLVLRSPGLKDLPRRVQIRRVHFIYRLPARRKMQEFERLRQNGSKDDVAIVNGNGGQANVDLVIFQMCIRDSSHPGSP